MLDTQWTGNGLLIPRVYQKLRIPNNIKQARVWDSWHMVQLTLELMSRLEPRARILPKAFSPLLGLPP